VFRRVLKGVMLMAALLLLPVPLASAGNMLANPGFEEPDATAGDVNTLTGWNAFGWDQLHWITRQVASHGGSQCLKMFGPWDQYGGVGATQVFPAVPGQTWIAQTWSMNYSGDAMQNNNFCVMKIEFQDASHALVGGTSLAGFNVFEERLADASTPQDVWTLHGLGTAPAPAGTVFVNFVIVEVQMGDPISGGSVFLDDAYLSEICNVHEPVFDVNDDRKVDSQDFTVFQSCVTGPAIPLAPTASQECKCMDTNGDNAIDMQDFGAFQACYTGAAGILNPACAN
jgi:hypothetical protein